MVKKIKVLSNSGKTMTSQWQLDDPREKILYKCAHTLIIRAIFGFVAAADSL